MTTNLAFKQSEWQQISIMIASVIEHSKFNTVPPMSLEWHLDEVYRLILSEVKQKVDERPCRAYPLTAKGNPKIISLALSKVHEHVLKTVLARKIFTNPIQEALSIEIVAVLDKKSK